MDYGLAVQLISTSCMAMDLEGNILQANQFVMLVLDSTRLLNVCI